MKGVGIYGVLLLALGASFFAGSGLAGTKSSALFLSAKKNSSQQTITQTSTSTGGVTCILQQQPAPLVQSSFQYKVVSNADECVLGKMGSQGWHEVQVGENSEGTGLASDCSTYSPLRLTWVLMEREVDSY